MTNIIEAHGRTYTRCCGTCRHWEKSGSPSLGRCDLNSQIADESVIAVDQHPFMTLDLALCSKWQEKDET